MAKANRALLTGVRGEESSRERTLSRGVESAVIPRINRPRGSVYLIRSAGRSDCRTHRRLMDEYNRAFNSWVAYTAQEEEHSMSMDTTTSQELAVARVEEKHQELLKHEQCCPNCKEG